VRRLECVECGRVSEDDERGWTARLTIDDEVAVYCPECNEREFGAVSLEDPPFCDPAPKVLSKTRPGLRDESAIAACSLRKNYRGRAV
jgi:hypothetical protein